MADRGSPAAREAPSKSDDGRPFVAPPWESPLDPERAIASIPADAKISGMFFAYMVGAAKARDVVLPSARDRYVPFSFYPVADLSRLLLEAAALLFPGRTLRHALRTLGRSGPDALLSSTLGKVTLGSTEGVHAAVAAMANAYHVNLRPSRVTVVDRDSRWMVIRAEKVHYFLDSHHVGTFEGVLKFAGCAGAVRIASRNAASADLLLTFDPASTSVR
jgi:uncharacterized protein (TIGR02265 family)